MTSRNALRRGGGVPHKMYGTFPFSRKTRSSRLKTFSLSSFNINSGRGPTLPRRHDESIAAAAEYVLLLRFCHLLPQRSNRTIKKRCLPARQCCQSSSLTCVYKPCCTSTSTVYFVYTRRSCTRARTSTKKPRVRVNNCNLRIVVLRTSSIVSRLSCRFLYYL